MPLLPMASMNNPGQAPKFVNGILKEDCGSFAASIVHCIIAEMIREAASGTHQFF